MHTNSLACAELEACVVRVVGGGFALFSDGGGASVGEGSRVQAVRCTLDAPSACAVVSGGAGMRLLGCKLGRPGPLAMPLGSAAGAARAAGGRAKELQAGEGSSERTAGLLAPLLAPLAPVKRRPAHAEGSSRGGAGAGAGGTGGALHPGEAPAPVDAAEGEGGGELWAGRCAFGAIAAGRGSVVEARGCAVAAQRDCVLVDGGARAELARCALDASVGWRGGCAVAAGLAPLPSNPALLAQAGAGLPQAAGRGGPSVVALHECRLRAFMSVAVAQRGGRVEGLRTCHVRRTQWRTLAFAWAGTYASFELSALVGRRMAVRAS